MDTIITIGRKFGSKGREIGQKVAEHYGIPCYDKELLIRAAKESGFCEEMIQEHDEKPNNSFLYNLVMDTYSFGYNMASFSDMPISHKVFLAQFNAIKKYADEGPCVIVGRCGDYALADYKNSVHVFVNGQYDKRVESIAEKYKLSKAEAEDMVNKKDKQRKSYYNYYSSKKWASVDSYDATIDSTVFGVDGSVQLIIDLVTEFEKKRNLK